MKPVPQHESYFLQGLEVHLKFKRAIQEAKTNAFDAGLYFLSAKQVAPHGTWETLVDEHHKQIPLRTVQRYMKFAADCLTWAKEINPKATDRQLKSFARDMVLQSALSFMELCREIGQVKAREHEGARDGKTAPEDRQLTFMFNWDAFDGLLLAVEHTSVNPFLQVEKGELEAARQRAAHALALIDQAITTKRERTLDK